MTTIERIYSGIARTCRAAGIDIMPLGSNGWLNFININRTKSILRDCGSRKRWLGDVEEWLLRGRNLPKTIIITSKERNVTINYTLKKNRERERKREREGRRDRKRNVNKTSKK